MEYKFIDPEKISDMLYNDAEYIVDFCKAGITSFEEFKDNFCTHLLDRNMEDLRKAGHKIKPGAQMMGAKDVIDEYEHAKNLLERKANKDKLTKSAEKMKTICSTIKEELTTLSQNPN